MGWAILKVSNTTPSCRKHDTVEKRGFSDFRDSIAKIYLLILTKVDPRSHMGNNKKFRTQRRAAGNPINRQKRGFRTSETDLLFDFDENWHNCVLDMPNPKNKKKIKTRAERSEAERSEAERSECLICLV